MSRQTIIRCSSLPQYSDCGRRSAARSFQRDIVAAGFTLRTTLPSIGAIGGTATHMAVELGFRARMRGEAYSPKELEDAAAYSVAQGIKDGVVWDDTTRDTAAAVKQAVRQARTVLDAFPELVPVAVEEELAADLGEGFILKGHVDFRFPRSIWDLKTGTVQRANQAQYGAYATVAKANGHTVDEVAEVYAKRVGVTKAQPEPEVVRYPVPVAEEIAWYTAQAVKRDVLEFRRTGSPWVWLPNPNSMMCGADWCPAWGTDFCKSHKMGKSDEKDCHR